MAQVEPAQNDAGTPLLEAPHVTGETTVDGDLVEDTWQRSFSYNITLSALEGDGARQGVLFVFHNDDSLHVGLQVEADDTTDDDWFEVHLASDQGSTDSGTGDGATGGNGTDSGNQTGNETGDQTGNETGDGAGSGASDSPDAVDALRFGGDASPTTSDQFLDIGSGGFVADSTRSGCAADGQGGRGVGPTQWTYELTKPLSADTCDFSATAGDTLAVRVRVFEAGSGMFGWPATDAENATGWADLTLSTETVGGEAGEGDGISTPGTSATPPGRLETEPDETIDPDQPIGGAGEDIDNPAYDARDREAPGVDMAVMVGFMVFGVIAYHMMMPGFRRFR